MSDIERLRGQIKACRICVESPIDKAMPHAPNPVVVLSTTARIAICGQAPGNKVNISGIPFTDPSGDRLRQWLGLTSEVFYDRDRIAIVPMGFCFPGHDKHGGDLPPRKECQLKWHHQVFAAMPQLRLKLLIGGSAQKYHLAGAQSKTVTQTVENWRTYLNDGAQKGEAAVLPLPHPSWRNTGWLKKNPWFEAELLPELQKQVAIALTP